MSWRVDEEYIDTIPGRDDNKDPGCDVYTTSFPVTFHRDSLKKNNVYSLFNNQFIGTHVGIQAPQPFFSKGVLHSVIVRVAVVLKHK